MRASTKRPARDGIEYPDSKKTTQTTKEGTDHGKTIWIRSADETGVVRLR